MLIPLPILLLPLTATATTLPLFQPWTTADWVASDDSARPGGLSKSTLEVLAPQTAENPFPEPIVKFAGTLDATALNGSGFASQRTVDAWPGLDLSAYTGLVLEVPVGGDDGKTYTLNIKDTVAPLVGGREQATVSWEWDFQIPSEDSAAVVVSAAGNYTQSTVKFGDLVPTFQGTVQTGIAPLNLTSIKRVNFMIRRYVHNRFAKLADRSVCCRSSRDNPVLPNS